MLGEPQPLAEIRAADPLALTCIAFRWTSATANFLTWKDAEGVAHSSRDPVIEAMAEGLGAWVIALVAPLNPEGGAGVKADGGAAKSWSAKETSRANGYETIYDHVGYHQLDPPARIMGYIPDVTVNHPRALPSQPN